MSHSFTKLICLFCLFFSVGFIANAQQPVDHDDPTMQGLLKAYEKKIYFTQNKGQWPGNFQYKADFPMGQAQATPEGMLVGTFSPKSLNEFNEQAERREAAQAAGRPFTEKDAELSGHGWLMKFLNSSPNMKMESKGAHGDKFNYFIGDDPSKHATDVLSYNEIWYNDVYKNTDVRYYPSEHGTLEYDIVCKPGSNPNDIVLSFDGIDKKHINEEGYLVLETSVGDMPIAPPVAYQKIDGNEVKVEVSYELDSKGNLTFNIGKYNKSETLVIDPIALVWATWASNNASTNSHGHGIHVDPATGIYIVGWYNSTGLITVNAFQNTVANGQDIILGRYQEPATVGGAGTRVWQTYLGGTGSDNPYAIDQGSDGIYITGIIPATGAIPYPMIGGAAYGAVPSTVDNRAQTGQNVFITKINLAGNSIKSCVVGGNGTEAIFDIRVTSNSGQVVVCGSTASTNLNTLHPASGASNTLNGTNDVLAFKVAQDLNSVIWIRNFGGSGTEQANIMLSQPTGDIFLAGTTTSANFPLLLPRQNTRVGTSDGFLMKLNGNGTTIWSSYYNSGAAANNTSILCMEFNVAKTRLIFGGTTSGLAAANISAGSYQPAYAGGTLDFFIGSLDTNQTFNWGSYFGGNGNEVNMMGLNLDLNNDVYIFGYTNGTFPTSAGAFESVKPGGNDKIFSKISSSGSTLLYSTYFGTSGNETDPVGERGIKFSDCRIYTIVTSDNNALPLTQGAITTNKLSANGILEMGIVEWGSPPPLANNTVIGTQVVCAGAVPADVTGTTPTYNLPNITRNGVISPHPALGGISGYQWQQSFDAGVTWADIPGATGITLPGNQIGPLTNNMRIRRIISGDLCVISADNNIIQIQTFSPTLNVTSSCQGLNNGAVNAAANGGTAPYTYLWSNGATTQNVTGLAPGVYTLNITDATGCSASSTVTVPEYPDVNIQGSPGFCAGGSTTLTATPNVPGATYLWSTGATSQSITVGTAGPYSVTVTFPQGCTGSASVTAVALVSPTISVSEVSGVNNNDGTLCAGESAVLTANPGPIYLWNTGAITQSITVSTSGTYSVTISGGGGCNGNASAPVVVNPLPTPTITGPAGICNAQTAVLNASGGNTYSWAPVPATTPSITATFPGTYSVTVTNSSTGCSALASFVLADNNCFPIANANSTTTPEDTPVNVLVIPNDNFGGDGPSTSAIVAVTQPANGTATVNNNGTPSNPTDDFITYTPNLNFNGVNSFIYRICDSNGDCDTAVVTVTVLATNDPPVAVNDVISTPEDTPLSATVIANDSDPDGPSATYTLVSGPANASAFTLFTNGTYNYTPNLNYNGTDLFTYQLCDGGVPNLCSTATVTITITPVNDPPIANANTVTTPEDTPIAISVLTNDTDVDGALNPATLTALTSPANGTISINGITGVITYTPNPNFSGVNTFIYRVCDTGTPLPSLCDTAVVTINVTAVNDPPIAGNDLNTTTEDAPVSGNVTGNDSDVDGPSALYTLATPPTNGSVVLNPGGTYTYTPNPNFNGTDVFTYQLCDGGVPNNCVTATVTITVTPLNDPPVAVIDIRTTPEDTPILIAVLGNDTDIDGSLAPNSVSVSTLPTNGTVTINNVTGAITYTPNPNFAGTDTFIYQVCDNGTPLPALCDTALVRVTVTALNDGPVAVKDFNTTNEDVPVTGTVIANDSDVDGPGAIYTLTTPPTNGSVVINPAGTYTYTPNPNFNGTDSFIYQLCDGGTPNLCDTALVTITVTPLNDAPIAVKDDRITPEDTPILITVLGNDSDMDGALAPSSVSVSTLPTNGSVTINNVTGEITYTPNPNFTGTDTFVYQVCDNGTPLPALCDTALVTIVVTPLNDAPIAVDDVNSTLEDAPVSGNVSPNDSDIDGPGATFAVVTTTPNGTLVLNPTGSYTYTPNPNFNGVDVFTYTICDGGTPNLCDTATVTITVTPLNDPPVVVVNTTTTTEDSPVVIPVLGNDSDVDGALVPGTVTVGTPPANGTVTINNITGEITYTPNPNFTGTDTFIYQVCDNGTPLPALCDTALVTVTVTPLNDAPIAVDDINSTVEDTPVSGNVSPNDSDVDGPATTFSVVTSPPNGTLVLNPGGTYTYTPNPNFNGTDVFTYQICDGGTPNLCDTASVTITVTPVNDPPIAVNDNVTTPEDVPVPTFVLGNDSDVDGTLQTTSVAIVTSPTNGSVSINSGTGVITYTPNPNYNGTDSYSYIVCDNGTPLPALCDTAVVTITITPVNDPVVVTVTPITTNEDAPTTPGTNCYAINDDPADDHTAVVCGVTNGTATVSVNNGTDQLCVNYTPNANYFGPDDICIIICDNGIPTDCDTIHIPVTVLPINDVPVANADNVTTPEDVPVIIPVMGNDTDIDGALVPNTVVGTPPANGTVSINNITGEITYTPNPNFSGTDTFIYQVCDNGTPLPALCDTAVVTVTVTPVNDPPIATDDSNTTPEDSPVSGNVSTNDNPTDGPGATYTTVGTPTGGTVTLNPGGTYTFTPTPNFTGTATFTYQVCDGGTPNLCDTAIVTINVTPVNDPPVAVVDVVSTNEDTPVTIPVLGNDSDIDGSLVPNTVIVGTSPANGSVTINNITGAITYTPNPGYNGTDTFIYQVCDNGTPLPSQCDTALVTVNVISVNDPPIANDDVNAGNEDSPITGNVGTNDNVTDGPTATYTLLTPSPNGTVTITPGTGAYTFTPNTNYNGVTTFTYTLCDGGTPVLCDTATVTLTVNPVNDPPIVNANTATTNEDTPVVIPVLGNDTDVDGTITTNSVATVTLPANGTVTINAGTGAITYTPNPNFNGTDSFIYLACDNGTPLPSLCDTAVVTITVLPVNDPPIANNDTNTGNEDSPITGNVASNDNLTDGPTATYTLLAPSPNGTVVITPGTGAYTFAPNANYNGVTTFTYTLCDGGAPNLCDTATVTITVNPLNDAPIVNANSATTTEDTPVTIAVLGNDTDIDGVITPASVATVTTPLHGTVSINALTGVITYTPFANYNGTDSFIYQACDNGTPLPSLCDTAVVTITITPVNDPPVANNDTYTTNEDVTLTATAGTNDLATDGPTTVYTVLTPSPNGTVTITNAGTGAFTYVPTANFNGVTTFTYTLCDNGTPNLCDTATVTITVNAVNDPPIVNADNVTTPEDVPVVISVLGNDTDTETALNPATVVALTSPANGTVTINGVTGQITYTPNPNFNGTDSFIYRACDNGLPLPSLCDTAVVRITVTPVNDAPIANNDVATTNEDTPVNGNVFTNDNTTDGPTNIFTVLGAPTNGTVVLDGTTGAYTFTPAANFTGTGTFTYTLCDGFVTPSLCDTATVTITVSPVNDPPVIDIPDISTPEDVPVTVCSPITDPDANQTFTATLCNAPANGTVSGPTVFNGQVCITYTPNANYNGVDSVCVILCDQGGLCDTSTTVITVTPVNDPPIAINDFNTTTEDVAVSGTVATNDNVTDGPLAIYTLVTGTSNGSVILNPDGTYTYTPSPNFFGTDIFTYSLCDGFVSPSLCSTATVTITVTPVNDPPIVNGNTATTNEDTPVVIPVLGNDTDVDGIVTTTSVAPVTLPTNGTITVNAGTGVITYTPNPNFNGTDSFIYIACDNGFPLPSICDTAVVTITVNAVNDPPVANANNVATPEDTPIVINVPGNDTDPDNNINLTSVTILSGPTNGSTLINPVTGAVTYTPAPNFNGTDVFIYQICDTGTPIFCDTAVVTITVTPVNDPPVINFPDPTTPEETPVTICSPITDPDVAQTFSATLCGGPFNGTVTAPAIFNGQVCITYTPSLNFSGLDSVCVIVCDQNGACDTSTTVITVTGINDPPIAVNDNYTTPEDTQLNGNVSTNDNGTDGPSNLYSVIASTTNGTLVLNTDGTFSYTPNLNYTGSDVFVYSLCDAGTPNLCDTATVFINVTPVNDPPVINIPDVTTPEETPVTVCSPITDPDANQTFTAGLCGGPFSGTVSGPTVFNGQVCITYTPAPNFTGLDSVCVVLCDQNGLCDTSITVITVTPSNDPPIANNDTVTTTSGVAVTIPVTNNDTDVDGGIDVTTVTIITPPTNGTVNVDPVTGVVTYTPNPGACGTDSFVYQVCDLGTPLPSLCDQATVIINIIDNQAPVITCPADVTRPNTPGQCGFTALGTNLNATALDNCGPVTLTHNYFAWGNPNSLQGATFPVGTTTVTWTATDVAGNTSTCTFNVTITDTQSPAFINCPDGAVITIGLLGSNCQGATTWPIPAAADNCSGVTVTQTGGPAYGSILPVGTYPITYTATDASGNTDTCSFTVQIVDSQTPTIVCPTNVLQVNATTGVCGYVSPANSLSPLLIQSNCTSTVTWSVLNPDATTTTGTNDVSGYTFAVGTSTVTYTVTVTASGATASCSFTVTVLDTQAPTFTTGCPTNITAPAQTGLCSAVVTWTPPTAADNCAVVSLTSTHNPGATFPVGTTTVTYTATDAAGNSTTCSFNVVVNDTQAPIITGCPTDISLNSTPGVCGAVATWTVPTMVDNCGATLTSNHNSGETFPVGTTTVTYTATDAAGNISTCTFTVTVADTQAPSFVNCPSNITVSNIFNTCQQQVYWPTVLVSDNCGSPGVAVSTTHSPGFVFPVGVTPVTYTAVDAAGNSTTCSFTVTVNDTQAPTIQGCPPNVTVSNTPNVCGAVVSWAQPSIFDNCPGVTITSSHPSGSTFPIGTTTVTYTATDNAGNFVTCSFTVTVNDTQAPVLTGCPTNMIVPNTPGLCGATVNWVPPTANDNCPGVVLTSNHIPGETFPLGVTTVTYTATDAAGLTTSCSFTIVVNDTQFPTITGCPTNISVNSAAGTCGAVVSWTPPTIIDNCPGLVVSSTHTPGSTFPVGTTTVTYTGTDAVGHISTCTFTVTVTDNVAPVITGCPANITVSNSFNLCGAPVFWTPPTITDNCGGMTVVSSHTSGTVFPIGTTTVTYTATDVSGNVSTCTFTITVNDTQFPQITGCPGNITANSGVGCTANVSWTVPSAFDNCPGVTLITSHAPGSPFPPGNTVVTYTATDASGNASQCSFTVTVVDAVPPVITNCPANIVTTTSPGICGTAVTWTPPTITDNCSVPTIVASHAPGFVFPKGTTTVTYTATDASGNVTTCTFTVTVNDVEAPTFANCPANIAVTSGASCSTPVTWTAPTATDNCPGVTVVSTHNSGDTFPLGVTTVTYTATDAVGNVSTCSFTVTVTDAQAPVVTGCPANITVIDQFNTCGAPIFWTPPTFTDNCPTGMTVVSSHVPGIFFPAGTTTVTYTATDISGNVTVCSFTITIVDQQLPQIASCPIDVTLNNDPGICGAVHNWVLPTVFDNCPGVTLTTTHPPGSVFPVGVTNVVYTATDVSNNTVTCSFNVTVLDNELPVITGCPANVTVSNTVGNCDGIATWTPPTATDNCSGGFTFTSSHNSGDVFPVGTTTVTYTATDAAGNITTCSFDVIVNDTELPIVTGCPANITLSNTPGVCESVATWTPPTATDNCSGGFTFTSNYNSGDVFPVGVTTVTYIATDNAGNITLCSFDVTVNDTELPVITGCPANINSCTDTITWTPPTASDNCGVTSFTSSHVSGTVFPVGTTTVTYTATDSAGNVTTCSFNVTVSMPKLTVVYTDVTCNGLNDGTATVIVTDAVGPFTFDWGAAGTDSLLTGLAPGTYTVTVSDGIGCSATDSVTILEPQVFDISAGPISTATCGFEDGNAVVYASGGNTPYGFTWSNGASTQSLFNVADGVYSLVAVDAKGCTDSLTITIECIFGRVPQLLTPNGDGHNDTWFIPGIDKYPEATVEVYNRWGNIVLKASPYMNDWAGISQGLLNVGKERLPAGTYFYVIKLTPNGSAMTGYIELQY